MLVSPCLDDIGTARDKPTLGMRNGKVQFRDVAEKHVFGTGNFQVNPPSGVFAVMIPSQSGIGLASIRFPPTGSTIGQDTGFQQCLKAVADSQHQFVSGQELVNNITQMTPKLAGKDNPGTDVVSVTEATRYAQDLIFIKKCRTLDKSKQVNSIRTTTAGIECIRRFDITIRSGST